VRSRTAIALLLVVAAVIAGCGTSTDRVSKSGPLHVYRTESFDGWNLDSAAAYASYQTDAAVIEPLLRFSADGRNVQPGLAKSWKYDPGSRSWTFVLQPRARFSDGKPVTAKDVVFSYGVWSKGINFGSSFAQIERVVAVDDHTVKFVMKAPDSTLPALLSGSVAGVMPADFGGRTKKAYYAAPIGAGPYVVKHWTSGGRIELGPNRHYYAPGRPKIPNINIDVVADDNELAILSKSGQADIVEYVSATTAGQYPKSKIKVTPTSQVEHLSLNVGSAPFDDLKVRDAVTRAVDYHAIVNGPFSGYAKPPTGILAPHLGNWAPPSTPYYSTDLPAAKRLMQGSTHPQGGSGELIYDAGIGADELVAQIVKANLAKIGINVKLTGLETLAFIDRAFAGKADMVVWSYGAISPDISDPLGWIAGTRYLFSGYDQRAFDKQRNAYLSTTSPAVKHRAVVAIQDEALRQAPAIALAEYPTIGAVATNLEGYAPAPWGLYYYDTISRG